MSVDDLKSAISALCEANCFDEVTYEERAELFQWLADSHAGYASEDEAQAA